MRRIEGQVRGIGEMVAKDRPEEDILIQLEAVKSSLSSTISFLVESLLKTDGEEIVLKAKEVKTILRLIKKN